MPRKINKNLLPKDILPSEIGLLKKGKNVEDDLRTGHVITEDKDKLVVFIKEYAVYPLEIEISAVKD